MKIKQTFIRTLKYDPCIPLFAKDWYPVTKSLGLCYKLLDENGDVYLVDGDAAEACPNWEIKTVEVEL